MQNKGAIVLFTILLGIVALFTLSKNVVSSGFESKIEELVDRNYRDSLEALGKTEEEVNKELAELVRVHLRDSANAEVYPVLGYTYRDLKKEELNFGLDLQGGMSVTLEVDVPSYLLALTGNTTDPTFLDAIRAAKNAQRDSQDDFLTLFEQAWNDATAGNENAALWKYFNTLDNGDRFPMNATDADIIEILRTEADEVVSNTEDILGRRIDRLGVAQPVIQKQGTSGRIVVELPGVEDSDQIRDYITATANLEFWDVYYAGQVMQSLFRASEAVGRALNPEAFDEVDETTADDATADAADADSTDDQATDVADDDQNEGEATEENDDDLADDELDEELDEEADEITDEEIARARLRSPIVAYANLNPQIPANSVVVGSAEEKDTAYVNTLLNHPEVRKILPEDLALMWDAYGREVEIEEGERTIQVYSLYAIKRAPNATPRIDGGSITEASSTFDQANNPEVVMRMGGEAASEWSSWTAEAAADGKRPIAISMDNLVFSAPSVQGQIDGGVSSISMGSGNRSQKLEDAEKLASLLNAGSLPARAKIVDQFAVGPTLGEANIKAGLTSFILALIVILVYMIFYYKGAGVVSNIALLINLLFLVGLLATFGAALTLPGIAGIVLTIGMAVDANVLIYERIREEIRLGKGMAVALKDGYRKAYSAIVDANITTLLTAIILFAFGSGPIRGFATTLMIGIFTSLFSAIVITRLVFFNRLEKKKSISFWTNLTKDWFTKMNYQFVANRRKFYILSGVIIAAGIGSIATRGVQYGVDFDGGTQFQVAFNESVDADAVRESLSQAFTEGSVKGAPTVQSVAGTNSYIIKTSYLINDDGADRESRIDDALASGLEGMGGGFSVESKTLVDPTMSDDFSREAATATIFSLLIIFAYIVFRFRKWQFGVGAIIAMIHDVLIVLSLFSLLNGIVGFSLEINQAFIAAILTVIGYSINDTVVVFDRIREYLGQYRKDDSKTVINRALNSTLSRTINTSLSTFVVLLTIFIFGGSDIKGFAFALMVGVIVGTYSSIFIATPSVVDLSKDVRS